MYQFSNNILPDIDFFQLNTLKGVTKAPGVDIFRLNILRGTKPAI